MAVIILKVLHEKQKSRTILKRSYRKFNRELFYAKLNQELMKLSMNNAKLKEFTDQFLKVFDNNHTSKKQKHMRAND